MEETALAIHMPQKRFLVLDPTISAASARPPTLLSHRLSGFKTSSMHASP
jgi:hypothetical protein